MSDDIRKIPISHPSCSLDFLTLTFLVLGRSGHGCLVLFCLVTCGAPVVCAYKRPICAAFRQQALPSPFLTFLHDLLSGDEFHPPGFFLFAVQKESLPCFCVTAEATTIRQYESLSSRSFGRFPRLCGDSRVDLYSC